ncbi:carboxypeptidase-like regulatory domain-containing protein [Petrimonas sp.]|uniref:TonB-dependent receptor n=1 Tax=Petrimonas sp. TaxID=2023866 RepID=UPI003F514460
MTGKAKVLLFKLSVLLLLLVSASAIYAQTGTIKGTIIDSKTKEPLIGATIIVDGTEIGTATNLDGEFFLGNLPIRECTLKVQYVGYNTVEVNVDVSADKTADISIEMHDASQELEAVVVVAQVRRVSDVAIISATKQGLVVQSGVSAQQITRTQDRDAGEVIKRVPGITMNDNKFVVVRGLSQRYNNVWVNQSAVPSSEADSRAFSFDIIPSSQLDNIMIVKSPAPEYPADFSGGFVLVNTKDIPARNGFSIGVTGYYNDNTHFKDFFYNQGSPTDFLGFDNGTRALQGNFPAIMDNNNSDEVTRHTKTGFNNNWAIKQMKPVADLGLNASFNRSFETAIGRWGMLGAVNYRSSSSSYEEMKNNRFSLYNWRNDQPEYVNEFIDDQYNQNVRLGAIFNTTFSPNGTDKYEFKNIFNQLATNRYTHRNGWHIESGRYKREQFEYYYNSRLTYNGQLSGKYRRDTRRWDWNTGYAFSNNMRPDRRRISLQQNDIVGDPFEGKMGLEQNEIRREFSELYEHIFTLAGNYEQNFRMGNIVPTLKAGLYGEYRTRDFANRQFFYIYNQQNLPDDFTYRNPVEVLTDHQYAEYNRFYIREEINKRNSYGAFNRLLSGYLGLNIPIDKFNIYAGVRYENNRMTLNTFEDIRGNLQKDIQIDDARLYPSINTTYKFNDKHQLRLAYGASVNRPEFREVAPFVYYDFDLFSNVMGNEDLKPAHIQNADLRYEIYPSQEEMISVALFYKHFNNPIEWTYLVSGSGYTYRYENALSARNFGAELEIKKNLSFIGMQNFAWMFNGSLIRSKVFFPKGSLEIDRPMQGQSDYIVNTGLFYQNQNTGISSSLLYNRIGRRISEVGRKDHSGGGVGQENDYFDTYEMPRNVIDFTFGKEFGSNWELKLSMRDVLAEKIRFMQFPENTIDGSLNKREQTVREYKPGRNIIIGVTYKF